MAQRARNDRPPENPWDPEDIIAGRNLKRLWNAQPQNTRISQNAAARQLHISQAAVSNYINGFLRLNIPITLRFALLLNVPPEQIDPRLRTIMKNRIRAHYPDSDSPI